MYPHLNRLSAPRWRVTTACGEAGQEHREVASRDTKPSPSPSGTDCVLQEEGTRMCSGLPRAVFISPPRTLGSFVKASHGSTLSVTQHGWAG